MSEVDIAYNEYIKHSKVPDNFDLKIFAYEYTPINSDDKFKKVFEGYFPYPRLFPFKYAHMFPKFMFNCKHNIKDEDGNICFNPIKGKYYTFVLIYQYYRLKKKERIKSKRIDVFYE